MTQGDNAYEQSSGASSADRDASRLSDGGLQRALDEAESLSCGLDELAKRYGVSLDPSPQAETNSETEPALSRVPLDVVTSVPGRHPSLRVTRVESGTQASPMRAFGTSTPISVSRMALNWAALTTGGALPPAASRQSRLMWRLSSMTNLWAFVEAQDNEWRATTLYRQIETSDKSQASYRVGTVMAGIAGRYSLGIVNLIHRQTQFQPTSSSRGDFVGRRPSDGSWHGLEAKGAGPNLNTGQAQLPTPRMLVKAKLQAKSLGTELRQRPLPVGADDHWAVHSVASTTEPFQLLIEDPPSDDGEPPVPLDPEVGFPGVDPEERLLQNYYQVVGDLEDAREFGTGGTRRQPLELDGYLGFRMPGSDFWLGAREELFAARSEQRLSEVVDDIARIALIDEPGVYADLGLAVVTQSVGDA
jgi:hypothetical protein